MRKRQSRPPKYAQISNDAVDTIPSLLAVGMLTRLIRAQDGAHVTVDSMTTEYAEGKVLLTKAMGVLVETGHVVKYKIQRARQEFVVEGGKKVPKNGGSWYTVFDVDSVPFTEDDVKQALTEILRSGNARAVRVEPDRLDPRNSGWSFSDMQDPDTRPRPAETQDDSSSAPTCRILTVGDPTVGEAAALSKTAFPKPERTNTPPPPSSVGAGEDATPEAPLEEDEEMDESKANNDGSAIAGAASRDETSHLEDAGSAVRLPVGFEEVRVVLDRLPRLEAAHVTTEGRLWGKIVEALGSGWDPVALAKVLMRHTDADKARSVRVLPDWYANAFDELPERPVKPVVPLCDNPAHQLNPQEDPVNGGCLLCNTQAATGPREKTTVASDTVRDPQDDGVAFGQAFRADLRAKRLLRTAEPSRSDTPGIRARREADRNRVKANDLLRTER